MPTATLAAVGQEVGPGGSTSERCHRTDCHECVIPAPAPTKTKAARAAGECEDPRNAIPDATPQQRRWRRYGG